MALTTIQTFLLKIVWKLFFTLYPGNDETNKLEYKPRTQKLKLYPTHNIHIIHYKHPAFCVCGKRFSQ